MYMHVCICISVDACMCMYCIHVCECACECMFVHMHESMFLSMVGKTITSEVYSQSKYYKSKSQSRLYLIVNKLFIFALRPIFKKKKKTTFTRAVTGNTKLPKTQIKK